MWASGLAYSSSVAKFVQAGGRAYGTLNLIHVYQLSNPKNIQEQQGEMVEWYSAWVKICEFVRLPVTLVSFT